MAQTQLADVIAPAEFTAYQVYPTFCWGATSRNLEALASGSSTVLVQNRRVYKQRVLRRLNPVPTMNMSEAMELRLDPDYRASQGRAALSTIEDALRWAVGNDDVRVVGKLPHNVSRFASSLIPKAPSRD